MANEVLDSQTNESKHANLLKGAGIPRIGRRGVGVEPLVDGKEPTGEAEPPARKPKWKTVVLGVCLGAVVVAITLAIFAVVGANNPL